jgi:hypothetical protein
LQALVNGDINDSKSIFALRHKKEMWNMLSFFQDILVFFVATGGTVPNAQWHGAIFL